MAERNQIFSCLDTAALVGYHFVDRHFLISVAFSLSTVMEDSICNIQVYHRQQYHWPLDDREAFPIVHINMLPFIVHASLYYVTPLILSSLKRFASSSGALTCLPRRQARSTDRRLSHLNQKHYPETSSQFRMYCLNVSLSTTRAPLQSIFCKCMNGFEFRNQALH